MGIANQKSRYYWATVLVTTVIAIVLFFGLRPKHWSYVNNASLLSEKRALSFRDNGIAYLDDVHLVFGSQVTGGWTVQIIVAPEHQPKTGFRPILMLHNGKDRRQLAVWQWGGDVIVMNGDDYDFSRKWPRVSAKGTFMPGKVRFITITSTLSGTSLYVDGKLAGKTTEWQAKLPQGDHRLRLILGNSVYGKQSWQGDIYGLAFYGKGLTPGRVQNDYEDWLYRSDFAQDEKERLLRWYPSGQAADMLMVKTLNREQQLLLPARQVVLQKHFLSPPDPNFLYNRSFYDDAIINFSGFIPLGAAIYYWLRLSPLASSRNRLQSVAFCFCLSLMMEIVQAWLPDRFSSLSDLALNSLGAAFGVYLLSLLLRLNNEA